ncbi:chromosome partitioning protein [Nakamurella flava]|uniref:Chromosome partitioning protein n=1 Tax=Nakamurella flava TaxID=2576308 RepID=A0A4U6QLU6_9ACTN|nr:chromosome partitioning protein [Nakamurella flava]TKV61503.1 chromosome partitioning protein [Nakamurella flava]
MSTALVTAGSGQNWENELVAALDRPGASMTVLRRCVDLGDVLAIAGTGQAAVAVLAAGLRRLDTEAVTRLRAAGVAVVGVHPVGDTAARERLLRMGISALVAEDAGTDAVVTAAWTAYEELQAPAADHPGSIPSVADPRRSLPPPATTGTEQPEPPVEPAPAGRVVAVWGPTGAPGRTTVAAGIATAAAAAGTPTVLVDADVYGGVLASAFGLLDESPGLAGACRQAANGRLDRTVLLDLCWSVTADLQLLTGIARADRWPEVRASAIPTVLGQIREIAALVVVDCGFAVEADEEISFDTVAPRRNGATLAVLAEADEVVVVGSADPPGLERLVRGVAELTAAVPDVDPRVVLNRCRPAAGGADEATAAVRRFLGLEVLARLPEDRTATDRAWRRGQPLADAAPSSALTSAFRNLAAALARPLATSGRRG